MAFTDEQKFTVSRRDILMRWYIEKKIDRTQFYAGRLWQHDAEASTIQPSASYVLDAPINQQQVWQTDGNLSDKQWRAVRRRTAIARYFGTEVVKFLDEFLAPTLTRAEKEWRSPLSGQRKWVPLLQQYLRELAIFYGQSAGSRTSVAAEKAHQDFSKMREMETSNAA